MLKFLSLAGGFLITVIAIKSVNYFPWDLLIACVLNITYQIVLTKVADCIITKRVKKNLKIVEDMDVENPTTKRLLELAATLPEEDQEGIERFIDSLLEEEQRKKDSE